MSYVNPDLLKHIDMASVRTIVDVGACDGTTPVLLAKTYPAATVLAFECNPRILPICKAAIDSSGVADRITLSPIGLGETRKIAQFHPFVRGNDGASSFFKRIDADTTQTTVDDVVIDTLDHQLDVLGANTPDLLCMDVQGYELNVLRGLGDRILDVKYIIA